MIRIATICAALGLLGPAALAEEGRTVVVDEALGSVPVASTSVITRAEMQGALSDLGEVLDRQPGLRVSRLGGLGSYAAARIRGSTPEQVLVLLDGMPLLGAGGGAFDLGLLPLGLLRRVTITRGTSPSAFGVSAIGGVVDVRTREPVGALAEIEAGAGSFDTRSLRGFVGLGDGESGGGLAVDYQGSAGDFPYRHRGGVTLQPGEVVVAPRNNNAFDRMTALGRGRLDLGDGDSLRLLNLLTWRRGGVPGVAIHDTSTATLETLRNLVGGELSFALRWTPGATLRAVHWLSWAETRVTAGGEALALGLGSSRTESAALGARLHLAVPITLDEAGAWRLVPTATVGFRHETYEGGGFAGMPGEHVRRRLAAVAGVTLDAAPLNASMVASGRFEGAWSESAGESRVAAHEGSARVGVAYRPFGGTVVRANVSQGARFPTPFELFGYTGTALGNPLLVPERGMTVDVGVQHDARWLPDGSHGSVSVTGFASWSEDLIQFVRNSQGVSRPENVAAARVAGVEAGVWCDLFSHLRLRGSLTWMRSEDRSNIAARRGKLLPYRPTWKTYLRAEGYRHVVGSGEVGLAMEVEHIAGDVLDHAGLVRNPPRLLIGIAAWAEALDRQVRISLDLRNLGDTQALDFQGYPLPGMTAMATLRWTPIVE